MKCSVQCKIDSADDEIRDCFSYGHVFIFVKITPVLNLLMSPLLFVGSVTLPQLMNHLHLTVMLSCEIAGTPMNDLYNLYKVRFSKKQPSILTDLAHSLCHCNKVKHVTSAAIISGSSFKLDLYSKQKSYCLSSLG